jgi:hypothetical protein
MTSHPHIVLMLRMTRAILPLPLMPSQSSQGQLYCCYPSKLRTAHSNVDTHMKLTLKSGMWQAVFLRRQSVPSLLQSKLSP